MSPDDDWALGQNEVDVRNEARNPLNAVEKSVALVQSIAGTEKQPCPVCGGGWWYEQGEIVYAVHGKDCAFIDANEATIFACRNPEQAWIDESRAEAEREDAPRFNRCLICVGRSMSDELADQPDDFAHEIASPSGLTHLTEGSGYTFCGKNCAPWERKDKSR